MEPFQKQVCDVSETMTVLYSDLESQRYSKIRRKEHRAHQKPVIICYCYDHINRMVSIFHVNASSQNQTKKNKHVTPEYL